MSQKTAIITNELVKKYVSLEDVIEIVDLKNLYEINNDLVGWIKIDGTNIDYPVMQNEDYYLRRNIYKNYSYYGTPYLAKYCDVNNSDNLVIYGHHIKNNSMFGELENYKKEAFYNDHKLIKFYTLFCSFFLHHRQCFPGHLSRLMDIDLYCSLKQLCNPLQCKCTKISQFIQSLPC